MDSSKDYYKTLGISTNADIAVIRDSYDALSQKYNPDIFHGSKQFAHDMMLELNKAYEVLSDVAKRQEYDAQRSTESVLAPEVEIQMQSANQINSHAIPDAVEKINLGAWRRFFARNLDLFIYEIVICAILIWLTPYSLISELSTGARIWLFLGVNAAALCLLESLVFSMFGNTVGKSILGITLASKEGKKLEFGDFLERAFIANGLGLAFGIPVVGIITQLIAKSRLEEKGETLWDKKLNFKVTLAPISGTRVGLYLLVFLIVATGNSVAMLSYKSSFIHSAKQLSSSNAVATPSTESQTTAPVADASSMSIQAENATTNAKEQYEIGLTAYKNKDYVKAFYWYKKSADQGLAEAQTNLGGMYWSGQIVGITQDNKQAAEWYRKAAEQGNASAQSSLGSMYSQGTGVPKDYIKAVALFRKAAEQGDAWGQYWLSNMYRSGLGVPKDYIQALMWINLAMSDDLVKYLAKSTRDELPSHLSQAQFNQAMEMSKACKEKNFRNCD